MQKGYNRSENWAFVDVFCSDYNKSMVLETFEAAIKYANDQVGYSIYADEFYKMIAWSVVKIGEREFDIFNGLIRELLERFENFQLAKYVLQFSENNNQFKILPTQYILKSNCNKINEIIRRKNNVGA